MASVNELTFGIGFDTGVLKVAEQAVDKSFEKAEKAAEEAAKEARSVWERAASAISAAAQKVHTGWDRAMGGIKKAAAFDVGPALKKMAQGAVVAGAAFAGMFAFGLNEAAAAEQSLNRIAVAARTAGVQDVPRFSASMNDLAFRLQRTTGFGQDLINTSLSMAITMGAPIEKAELLTKASLDLSAALGIDVNSAFRNLAKTTSGLAGELGELIPELRGLSKEQLQAGAAIDIVALKFRGVAEQEADTLRGQLRILKEQWSDLVETFVTGATSTGSLKDGIAELNARIDEAFPKVEALGRAFGDTLRFALDAADGVSTLTDELLRFLGLTEDIPAAGGIRDLLEKEERLEGQKRRLQEIREEITRLVEIQEGRRGAETIGEFATAGSRIQELTQEYARVGKTIQGLTSEIEGLTERKKELVEQGKKWNQELESGASGLRGGSAAAKSLAAGMKEASDKTKDQKSAALQLAEAAGRHAELLTQQHGLEREIFAIRKEAALEKITEEAAQSRIIALLARSKENVSEIAKLEGEIASLREAHPSLVEQVNVGLDSQAEKLQLIKEMLESGRSLQEELGTQVDPLAGVDALGNDPGAQADERGQQVDMLERIAQYQGLAEALRRAGEMNLFLASSEQQQLVQAHRSMVMTQTLTQAKGMLTSALGNAARGFVQMAIAGEVNIKKLLHGVLSSIAQEAAVKAVFQVAEGFAMLFTAPPAAAAHFKSAALYGAVAALAGAGAAATRSSAGSEGASAAGGGGGTGNFTPRSSREEPPAQIPGTRVEIVVNGPVIGGQLEEVGRALEPYVRKAVTEAGGRSG